MTSAAKAELLSSLSTARLKPVPFPNAEEGTAKADALAEAQGRRAGRMKGSME
jgi:hypothetical protein